MFDLGRPSKKCVKVVEFFKAKNKAFHLPIHWMPDAGYRIPVAEMSSEVVLTLVLNLNKWRALGGTTNLYHNQELLLARVISHLGLSYYSVLISTYLSRLDDLQGRGGYILTGCIH